MSKNIIWILIIGFVLGFISYEQLSNFSTTKGNASFWEIVSAILVPVALAGWAWYSEKKKDKREQKRIEERDQRESDRIDRDKKELKRKEDKEYIQTYIEKYLISLLMPLILGQYEFKVKGKEKINAEIIVCLLKISLELLFLKQFVKISSYSYMMDYFSWLLNLSGKNDLHENLSTEELITFFAAFSADIRFIPSFLLWDENKYQEAAVISIISYIKLEGKIRDTTLEILKKYPLYEKSALDYIKCKLS